MKTLKNIIIEKIKLNKELIFVPFKNSDIMFPFIVENNSFLMSREEWEQIRYWNPELEKNKDWKYLIYLNNAPDRVLDPIRLTHELGHYISFKEDRFKRIFNLYEKLQDFLSKRNDFSLSKLEYGYLIHLLDKSYNILENKANIISLKLLKENNNSINIIPYIIIANYVYQSTRENREFDIFFDRKRFKLRKKELINSIQNKVVL